MLFSRGTVGLDVDPFGCLAVIVAHVTRLADLASEMHAQHTALGFNGDRKEIPSAPVWARHAQHLDEPVRSFSDHTTEVDPGPECRLEFRPNPPQLCAYPTGPCAMGNPDENYWRLPRRYPVNRKYVVNREQRGVCIHFTGILLELLLVLNPLLLLLLDPWATTPSPHRPGNNPARILSMPAWTGGASRAPPLPPPSEHQLQAHLNSARPLRRGGYHPEGGVGHRRIGRLAALI